MAYFPRLLFWKSSFSKRCGGTKIIRESFRRVTGTPLPSVNSKGALFFTPLGLTSTCYASKETASEYFNSNEYQQLLLSATMTLATLMQTSRTVITQTDYLEHDSQDYDIYINNPTAEDLPYLLNQFEEHGKEVWPWIWTHPNEAGPHFVFIGVNVDTLDQIRKLRSKSLAYNILVIASEKSIIEAANEAGDPNIYEETHCGIVSDATLELLNAEAKILMLSDERVIAFDSLTII